MEITVTESTVVKPSEETSLETIWISNTGALFPTNYHVRVLYFYRPTGTTDFFNTVTLKAALGRALVHFYPLAGRLKEDNNGRIEINCNGEGALFVAAECDGEMDELGEYFIPKPNLTLVPPVDYSQGISSYPLFLAQVTRFKCGGVCVGIAMEHHSADGISGFHFIKTWSDIARGLNNINIMLSFDRRVLSARNPPQPKYAHIEYQPPPTMKIPLHNGVVPETTYSTFKLTKDQLNALKAKCKKDNESVSYTTYETLAGHVWRCVTILRQLPEDQQTKLNLAVDGRSRLEPTLPPGYFGNVIFNATPIASAGELQSNPLKFSVSKVHEAISQMDNEYIRSAIDYLELQSDFSSISQGLFHCPCPNVGIISWTRLPLYDADFGWGRPVYTGPAKIPHEGRSYVLPSATNDGSILFAISLPNEEMQHFEKLFYDI